MANKKAFTVISKQKFQEIINNLDVIYFKGELKGKLLIHNTALNRILGLNPSISLTGCLASQFFSDTDLQKKYYETLEEKGFVKDFVVSIKKPDGSILYLQINSHLIKEGDNMFVEGTVTDITEKFLLE